MKKLWVSGWFHSLKHYPRGCFNIKLVNACQITKNTSYCLRRGWSNFDCSRSLSAILVSLQFLQIGSIATAVKAYFLGFGKVKIWATRKHPPPFLRSIAQKLHELGKQKDWPLKMARDLMLDVSYFGTMMGFLGRLMGWLGGNSILRQQRSDLLYNL